MKNFIYLLENQGVNYFEIWDDTGLFLCFVAMFSIYVIFVSWAAKNDKKDTVKKAKEAAESMLFSISHELDMLIIENSYLKETIKKYKYSERKRDEKGHFLPVSGNGHGKKDWTTATEKELITEAKRRYKKGDTLICLHEYDEVTLSDENFEFCGKAEMWGHGEKINALIFNHGIWAKKAPVKS